MGCKHSTSSKSRKKVGNDPVQKPQNTKSDTKVLLAKEIDSIPEGNYGGHNIAHLTAVESTDFGTGTVETPRGRTTRTVTNDDVLDGLSGRTAGVLKDEKKHARTVTNADVLDAGVFKDENPHESFSLSLTLCKPGLDKIIAQLNDNEEHQLERNKTSMLETLTTARQENYNWPNEQNNVGKEKTVNKETYHNTTKTKKKKKILQQRTNRLDVQEEYTDTPRNFSPRTSTMIDKLTENVNNVQPISAERQLKLTIKEMTFKAKEVESACKERVSMKKTDMEEEHIWPKKFYKSMNNIQTFIQELKLENIKINEEKESYLNRLSKVAGLRMTNNNPNITNLQDVRRPDKLAEEYSKIYDDQWTDAMENLEIMEPRSDNHQEKCVHHLFSLIKAIYISCKHRSERQLQGLVEHLFLLNNPSVEQIDATLEDNPEECQKMVEKRKKTASIAIKMLQQTIMCDGVFIREIEDCKPSLDESMYAFLIKSEYFRKCVEICWYFVIQDPPMYLETLHLYGTRLNKNTHRMYTTHGEIVKYAVWPALYQHNNGRKGPLMIQGVVQPSN